VIFAHFLYLSKNSFNFSIYILNSFINIINFLFYKINILLHLYKEEEVNE